MNDNRTSLALILLFVTWFLPGCGLQSRARERQPDPSTTSAKKEPARYVNSTNKFSVMLPPDYDHLEENNDIETSPQGTVLISYYSWLRKLKSSGVCGVVVYRLSDGLTGTRKPEEILDLMIRAKTNQRQIQQRRSFAFQRFPAVSYRTSFSDEKGIAYSREFFVYSSGSVYRVNFISSSQGELDSPEIESFFESFHIDREAAG